MERRELTLHLLGGEPDPDSSKPAPTPTVDDWADYPDGPPPIPAALLEQLDRDLDEVRAGRMETIPSTEVHAKARRLIAGWREQEEASAR